MLFEWVVLLLVGALLLAGLARRVGAPYPTFLALGGAVLAFVPGAPRIALEPDLALALFLAPVLMDAAYDASWRDLKINWLPIAGLVLGAVGVTTAAVAIVAKALLPDLPWAAAIALGAVVAPPDAAAATAVLRRVGLPHRLLVILEGESLLNDASSLLVYRLAVAATLAGAFSPAEVAPAFLLGVAGSLVAGPLLGWLFLKISAPIEDVSTSIVLQFVAAFGVWLLAERLELSAVLTIVTYGLTIARHAPLHTPAHQRQPSYAVWETAVFVLNVLAFVLIGLQVGPILEGLEPGERLTYGAVALAVLATTMLVRFAWVMGSGLVVVAWRRWRHEVDREADAAFLKRAYTVLDSGLTRSLG